VNTTSGELTRNNVPQFQIENVQNLRDMVKQDNPHYEILQMDLSQKLHLENFGSILQKVVLGGHRSQPQEED
jgi:hypothetical protein